MSEQAKTKFLEAFRDQGNLNVLIIGNLDDFGGAENDAGPMIRDVVNFLRIVVTDLGSTLTGINGRQELELTSVRLARGFSISDDGQGRASMVSIKFSSPLSNKQEMVLISNNCPPSVVKDFTDEFIVGGYDGLSKLEPIAYLKLKECGHTAGIHPNMDLTVADKWFQREGGTEDGGSLELAAEILAKTHQAPKSYQ